jgi:disulfide bond formation protein DsbB
MPCWYQRIRRWWLLVLGSAILIYETLTPGDARTALAVTALALVGINEAAELLGWAIPRFMRNRDG